jgi:hypothetical protein
MTVIDASGFHAPVVEARRKTMRAHSAALEGSHDAALAQYLDAIRAWRELRVTWEEAMTGLDMVSVLDLSLPEVVAVADSTRAIFERLGARPYLARLDDAMSRATARRRSSVTRTEAQVVPTRSS